MKARIGLVSDSHGFLDPRLHELLARCDSILHAGDIVKPEVLSGLRAIAPVTAVRGNNDEAVPTLAHLPETALVAAGALTALVVHDLGSRERPAQPARAILARRHPEIVVHGHSHRHGAALLGRTLFVNPGSAGPRRFTLPRTAAILEVRDRAARVVFYDLAGDRPRPLGETLEVEL